MRKSFTHEGHASRGYDWLHYNLWNQWERYDYDGNVSFSKGFIVYDNSIKDYQYRNAKRKYLARIHAINSCFKEKRQSLKGERYSSNKCKYPFFSKSPQFKQLDDKQKTELQKARADFLEELNALKGNMRTTKNCLHFAFSMETSVYPEKFSGYRYYDPFPIRTRGITSTLSAGGYYNVCLMAASQHKGFMIDGEKLSILINRSLPAIDDILPVNNIVTFLMELKDLPRLLPDFVSTLKALIKSKPSSAADSWLWTNFALLPTAGDFSQLFTIFSMVKSALNYFNTLADKNQIFTIRKTLGSFSLPEISLAEPLISFPNILPAPTYSVKDEQFVPRVKVRLVMKYKLKPFTNGLDELIHHLLGLDQIISGIWNGLPFSWLVDYFTNVGDIIDNYLSQRYIMPYEVIDASLSYSVPKDKRFYWLSEKETIKFSDSGKRKAVTLFSSIGGDLQFYKRVNILNLASTLADLRLKKEMHLEFGIPSQHRSLNLLAIYFKKKKG